MRDFEERARADAAYDAWRSGGNYDDAWDAAEDAIDRDEPYDYDEAYTSSMAEIHKRRERIEDAERRAD